MPPFPDEVVSSWLIRVGSANAVPLRDLIGGLRLRHPRSCGFRKIDCSLPPRTIRALARFCRADREAVRRMDLQNHAPELDERCLLRFRDPQFWGPRARGSRVRYAFCPSCLLAQPIAYVRWDWCFAAITRCSSHGVALRDGCPHCGDEDPLEIGHPPPKGWRCCECEGTLAEPQPARHLVPDENSLDAVAEAYRWALRSVADKPALLGKTTDREFRAFVNDMLDLLAACMEPDPVKPPSDLLRWQDYVTIIGDLVRNAAPTAMPRRRSARRRRGRVLWATLLHILNDEEGDVLERKSLHWPPAIQRRLASGILFHRRRRWPFDLYRPSNLSPRIKYNTLAAVFDLSARKRPSVAQSAI